MKKICTCILLIIFLVLLSACHNDSSSDKVENGTYILDQKESDEGEVLPYINIEENKMVFSYNLLSSYLPYGTFTVKDGMLTMTTDDKKYTYVFQIDGDNLIFQKDKSSSVNLIDDRLGTKLTDQAKFHRREE